MIETWRSLLARQPVIGNRLILADIGKDRPVPVRLFPQTITPWDYSFALEILKDVNCDTSHIQRGLQLAIEEPKRNPIFRTAQDVEDYAKEIIADEFDIDWTGKYEFIDCWDDEGWIEAKIRNKETGEEIEVLLQEFAEPEWDPTEQTSYMQTGYEVYQPMDYWSFFGWEENPRFCPKCGALLKSGLPCPRCEPEKYKMEHAKFVEVTKKNPPRPFRPGRRGPPYGIPKRDGSGLGRRRNFNRAGCRPNIAPLVAMAGMQAAQTGAKAGLGAARKAETGIAEFLTPNAPRRSNYKFKNPSLKMEFIDKFREIQSLGRGYDWTDDLDRAYSEMLEKYPNLTKQLYILYVSIAEKYHSHGLPLDIGEKYIDIFWKDEKQSWIGVKEDGSEVELPAWLNSFDEIFWDEYIGDYRGMHAPSIRANPQIYEPLRKVNIDLLTGIERGDESV